MRSCALVVAAVNGPRRCVRTVSDEGVNLRNQTVIDYDASCHAPMRFEQNTAD